MRPNQDSIKPMTLYTTQWPAEPSQVAVFVCALLNSNGGELVFGKSSDGNTIGFPADKAALEELVSVVRSSISPEPFMLASLDQEHGGPVARIRVPKGCDTPYLYQGKVYLIEDGKIGYADQTGIRMMVLRGAATPIRWEERYSTADIQLDLDENELRNGAQKAALRKRVQIDDEVSTEELLRLFEVFKSGCLINAGDVLFGKRPGTRAPQVRIRAYAYASDKTGDEFVDSEIIDAPLCRAIGKAMAFIARNTSQSARFAESVLARESGFSYPEDALREALVNAVAHRDYSSSAGSVTIHIYPTRLEIWNSGELPQGVDVDSLGTEQISVIRNPSIAYGLYLRGFMEQAGRGNLLMVQKCEAAHLPRPEWRVTENSQIVVTFKRFSSMGHEDAWVAQKNEPLKKSVSETARKKILDLLSHADVVNRRTLSSLLNTSESTVKRVLDGLIADGLVCREGGKRYGGYKLILPEG